MVRKRCDNPYCRRCNNVINTPVRFCKFYCTGYSNSTHLTTRMNSLARFAWFPGKELIHPYSIRFFNIKPNIKKLDATKLRQLEMIHHIFFSVSNAACQRKCEAWKPQVSLNSEHKPGSLSSGIFHGTKVLAICFKVVYQALQKFIFPNCFNVADDAALPARTSYSHIHPPVVTQKSHLQRCTSQNNSSSKSNDFPMSMLNTVILQAIHNWSLWPVCHLTRWWTTLTKRYWEFSL